MYELNKRPVKKKDDDEIINEYRKLIISQPSAKRNRVHNRVHMPLELLRKSSINQKLLFIAFLTEAKEPDVLFE